MLYGLKKTLLSKNFFDFKISHNSGAIFYFSQACLSDKITDQELGYFTEQRAPPGLFTDALLGIQSDAFLNALKIVFKHSK